MGRSVVSSGLKDVALSSNLKSWEGGKRRTKALLKNSAVGKGVSGELEPLPKNV